MARCIALVIVAAFWAAFGGLDSHEAFLASRTRSQAPAGHGAAATAAAAGAFLLAIVATFTLASALLLAHVRALGAHPHAAGPGGAEHGFATGRLAAATLAAAAAVLSLGAVLRLVA
ncbi:hypothetical protein PVAP13_4KG174600 [Panicum virgatum]|uniref:Uncharacterized protein n=1 Tax=Panicum virgatum TaxID=38727 RepID=A0A8T0TMY9_PANVG|nr:hypothetical protein PVAP13_4KG174600 [Panicum virgatum]